MSEKCGRKLPEYSNTRISTSHCTQFIKNKSKQHRKINLVVLVLMCEEEFLLKSSVNKLSYINFGYCLWKI